MTDTTAKTSAGGGVREALERIIDMDTCVSDGGKVHDHGPFAKIAIRALASPVPAMPDREITDGQIDLAVRKFAQACGNEGRLTYDSGAYEITKATHWALGFARTILALSPDQPRSEGK